MVSVKGHISQEENKRENERYKSWKKEKSI